MLALVERLSKDKLAGTKYVPIVPLVLSLMQAGFGTEEINAACQKLVTEKAIAGPINLYVNLDTANLSRK